MIKTKQQFSDEIHEKLMSVFPNIVKEMTNLKIYNKNRSKKTHG